MKNVLCVITLMMFMLTACTSVSPSATATLIPIIAPAETATSIPNPTATEQTVKPTKTPETISPFDLESKTCPVDDAPAILAAVQEKFHFSADTPNGNLITNNETSPTYQGSMEVAYKAKLTGIMKDPSGKEGDVDVTGPNFGRFPYKSCG